MYTLSIDMFAQVYYTIISKRDKEAKLPEHANGILVRWPGSFTNIPERRRVPNEP